MMQSSKKLKVLFVDDEPMILEGLAQLFDTTYDVHTVCCGQEAIEYVRQHPDIAIVVSDQRMPGLKGIDVLKAIKEISPDTIRILLTGFADADAILDSVNVGEVFRYVKKPWKPDELTAIVSLAAATYLSRKKVKEAKEAAKKSEPVASPEALELSSVQSLAMQELQKQRSIEEKFFNRLTQAAPGNVEQAFQSPSGKPKILVVDDEQGVLTALTQLLSDSYEVFTARSADEAMALLKQDSFMTLLLTDQRMPKKTGTDFLIESREIAPLVPKILITAYTDVEDIIRLINEGQIYRYIQKPWHPEKLRETIAEAIDLYLYQVKSKLEESSSNGTSHHSDKAAQDSKPALNPNNTLSALAALSQMAKQKSQA
ncbi:MAG: response regulator [Chloroherpetonaceae bacterium]|nr:response regulator [Chloroherpetonaceae bacterium]